MYVVVLRFIFKKSLELNGSFHYFSKLRRANSPTAAAAVANKRGDISPFSPSAPAMNCIAAVSSSSFPSNLVASSSSLDHLVASSSSLDHESPPRKRSLIDLFNPAKIFSPSKDDATMTHIGVHVLEYHSGDSEDSIFGIALSMALLYTVYRNQFFLCNSWYLVDGNRLLTQKKYVDGLAQD